MKAGLIEGSEPRPIGAPSDWREDDAGHCGGLFVRLDSHAGYRFMRSAWEASADEAGWLLAGAMVQLGISAPQHPVVQMGIGPAPEDFQPVWTVRPSVMLDGTKTVRVTRYAPKGSCWMEVPLDESGLAVCTAAAINLVEQRAAEAGQ